MGKTSGAGIPPAKEIIPGCLMTLRSSLTGEGRVFRAAELKSSFQLSLISTPP